MNADVASLDARHRDGDGSIVEADGLTQLRVIKRLLKRKTSLKTQFKDCATFLQRRLSLTILNNCSLVFDKREKKHAQRDVKSR